MRITYRPATRQIEAPAHWSPYGGWISAALEMPRESVSLGGLRIEILVSVNGETVAEDQWPRPGVKPRSITVAPSRVGDVVPLDAQLLARWQPEDNVSVWVRITTRDLEKAGVGPIESTFSFTAPLPPQPYPSWTWGGGEWQAPLPMPDDGQPYRWDEAGQAWVAEGNE